MCSKQSHASRNAWIHRHKHNTVTSIPNSSLHKQLTCTHHAHMITHIILRRVYRYSTRSICHPSVNGVRSLVWFVQYVTDTQEQVKTPVEPILEKLQIIYSWVDDDTWSIVLNENGSPTSAQFTSVTDCRSVIASGKTRVRSPTKRSVMNNQPPRQLPPPPNPFNENNVWYIDSWLHGLWLLCTLWKWPRSRIDLCWLHMCAYAHVAVHEHAYMMHVCVNELSLIGEFARLCDSQSNTNLVQCWLVFGVDDRLRLRVVGEDGVSIVVESVSVVVDSDEASECWWLEAECCWRWICCRWCCGDVGCWDDAQNVSRWPSG